MPLVCPACRRHSERGLELSTLDPIAGELRCRGCARRWPVVDGIPVLLREAEPVGLLADLSSEAAPLLAADQAENAPLPHLLAQLSSYLGAYEAGFEELAAALRDRPRVHFALELGCGVGRALAELSPSSELLVGLDRSGAFLRAARTLLRGGELRYFRRVAGRHYEPATLHKEPLANVEFICGDALDPPFAPATFERVAALNLLDNVPSPRALLHHMHQLCAPGGELLLSSPFAWRDGIVDEAERLGALDPAEGLRSEARALGWTVEEERELRWAVRHDARAATHYRVHFLRARRP